MLETTTAKIVYPSASGADTSFAYDFLVLSEDHMVPYLDGEPQTSGWSITGLEDPSGGNVIFAVAPDAGTEVVLYREVPLTQLVDYQAYDRFPAETHEAALDKLTMAVQQLYEQISRALKSGVGDDGTFDWTLPAPGPGYGWQVNATGDGVEPTEEPMANIVGAAQEAEANALAQAVNAANCAAEAYQTLVQCLGVYDDFDDRYLGGKPADPTVDNDGGVLLVGALYWNTISNVMKTWNGTSWDIWSVADGSITQAKMAFNWDRKNLFINSDFDIWQYGTNVPGPQPAEPTAADRWLFFDGGDGTVNVSREEFPLGQTDVLGNPKYYARHDMTVAATSGTPGIFQRVESSLTLAGNKGTLSFWAKSSSGAQVAYPGIQQRFGTGGSPSASIDVVGSPITLTTAWQFFEETFDIPSISGKTLGTDGNDSLQAGIDLPLNETWTVDFAHAQFEEGEVATPQEKPSTAQEIVDCQRFFRKSYSSGAAPGTATVNGCKMESATRNQNNYTVGEHWGTQMRDVPIITLYSTAGAAGSVANAGDKAAVAENVGRYGFGRVAITAGVASSTCSYHYTAKSEL